MSQYIIITDSSSDLNAKMIEKYGIASLDLAVTVEGEDPKLNSEIDPKAFYASLRSKKGAKTSAVAIESFKDFFRPYLEQGTDILYLGFSSGLSGTYQCAFVAAREMREEFPARTILTVDTLCASLGQGLLVHYAVQKRDEGADIRTVCDYIESIKLNLCHLFTVDDLFFLKRGGRVSTATAIVGSALGIKPVMHVDNEGHLIKIGIKRGRRASIDDLCARMQATAIDPAEQTVFISHGDCLEDAEYLAQRIRETMGAKEIFIDYVGPVIGAHSGPGTLALFFIGKER